MKFVGTPVLYCILLVNNFIKYPFLLPTRAHTAWTTRGAPDVSLGTLEVPGKRFVFHPFHSRPGMAIYIASCE